MQVKIFEIRDSMTFFSVVAVEMKPSPEIYSTRIDSPATNEDFVRWEAERYLLRRAGYAVGPNDRTLIVVGRTDADGTSQFCYDPFSWTGGGRTIREAHRYIEEHWSELKSGDVIDVEYILGEATAPKKSERVNHER